MAGRCSKNTANIISSWMICSFVTLATFNAHATTVNYTLDNVLLVGGQPITGTFDWTYSVGDFDGGTGIFTALDIPYTPYSFAAGNLNLDIQTNAIEISGNGNYHDMGLDITLRLSPSLLPTQSAPVDTDPTQSFFECCGNGFKDQAFQSGRIAPSAFLVGDFDIDGDADGFDFLKWQRGGVSGLPSASDLEIWEANYGTTLPLLSAAIATVPEPNAVLLGVMASLISISFRRLSSLGCISQICDPAKALDHYPTCELWKSVRVRCAQLNDTTDARR